MRRRWKEVAMLKTLQLAGSIGAALVLLLAGGAQAGQIGGGTLSVSLLFSPAVDPINYQVTFGGPEAYFSGTGAFNGFSGLGTTAGTTFSFDHVIGHTVSYAADPINDLITFTNAGDTYSFNLDTSIKTTNFSYIAGPEGSGTIALYILGDLTDSNNAYSMTPAQFTLTLNETGGSNWSASATLATVSQPAAAPEPASMFLLGGGLAALGLARRRKKT
jgi:hypothetical protein